MIALIIIGLVVVLWAYASDENYRKKSREDRARRMQKYILDSKSAYRPKYKG